MPLRVYCPDCHAPRTAPEAGARVRCRACGRAFRAGTRAERRPRSEDPTRQERPDGSRPLLFVLGAIALLIVGLTIGGGLAAWFFLARPAACPLPDDEVIEVDEDPGPPPVVHPVPLNPGPPAEEDP